jgi:hypothetical protein
MKERAIFAGIYRYRGVMAVSITRLTLNLDGTMIMHHWRDMGGHWDQHCQGRYSVEGSLIYLRPESPKPLHARQIEDTRILVPEIDLSNFENPSQDTLSDWAPFRDRFRAFWKEHYPRPLLCIKSDGYTHALTVGKVYMILKEREDAGLHQVRLHADHGRTRWFPTELFCTPEWTERSYTDKIRI